MTGAVFRKGKTAPSFYALFRKTGPERRHSWRKNGWRNIWSSTTWELSTPPPAGELELTFGIKGIQVRHMVNALRRDGVPIASNGSGYFYAATDQEVRATIAHLTRRISGIAAAIRGLDRTLEREDTAQTRLPLDGGDTP